MTPKMTTDEKARADAVQSIEATLLESLVEEDLHEWFLFGMTIHATRAAAKQVGDSAKTLKHQRRIY
jgi:hypothetical protein